MAQSNRIDRGVFEMHFLEMATLVKNIYLFFLIILTKLMIKIFKCLHGKWTWKPDLISYFQELKSLVFSIHLSLPLGFKLSITLNHMTFIKYIVYLYVYWSLPIFIMRVRTFFLYFWLCKLSMWYLYWIIKKALK